MLGDRLYLGTFDGHLVALDAKTGSVIWDVEVGDYRTGHSITGIPIAVKDKIIVGVALGEMGIRGFIDAYDAQTGKQVWRFYTIPAPGEPENETWEGDSCKTGGAAVWLTGSYDPDVNLTYWGTADPSPPFNGEVRKGDNLYSDSVVALDADSGKLKWHFQFTPHDVHDFDAVQIPVLVDAQFRDSQRKLMLFANNNGFFYLLDRESGEFLLARQFAKQNWADGIDGKGRSIRRPGTSPIAEGTLTYPKKAALWFSPSYHPGTSLFYVSVIGSGHILIAQPVPKERLGINLAGGSGALLLGQRARCGPSFQNQERSSGNTRAVMRSVLGSVHRWRPGVWWKPRGLFFRLERLHWSRDPACQYWRVDHSNSDHLSKRSQLTGHYCRW